MFRALWIAQFASNVGTWMQTVGAQWLLIDSSPLLVSLVQTASSLPIVLLALPAGAWADLVDRRRLLLGAQLAMFTAATALAVGTFLGITSPAWVLLLTFVLGCGNAVAAPAWQAIQPDLVERSLLPQAAALNGLNMNVARAVGPAIGGLVVAWVGAGWVFALNAISFVGIAAVIGMWRPPERAATGPRERLVEALRSGGRYVRNALIVRRLLYRAILFIPAASAVWALLPVLAAGNLGLGSAGYGLLLGMVGIGAVAGAFLIPRARARIGSARLVTGAMVVTAVALAVIAASSNPLVVGVAQLPVGSAWIAVMSSLNSGLQLTLPNWVRARGLAYYLVVFQGAQALGGVLWGVVADATDGATWAAPAGVRAPCGGSCSATAAKPPGSSSPTTSAPGPSTCGSTRTGSPVPTAGSRSRPAATPSASRRSPTSSRRSHRGREMYQRHPGPVFIFVRHVRSQEAGMPCDFRTIRAGAFELPTDGDSDITIEFPAPGIDAERQAVLMYRARNVCDPLNRPARIGVSLNGKALFEQSVTDPTDHSFHEVLDTKILRPTGNELTLIRKSDTGTVHLADLVLIYSI